MSGRILAVDDVAHNLELMTYLLAAYGFDVAAASTGTEALDAALAEPPDLVVLDLQLPDLDGYEVLTRMRREPRLAGIPVLAVTAFAMLGDRDAALAAGFDGYLAKPIDPATLADTINAHLPAERRGRRRGAAHAQAEG